MNINKILTHLILLNLSILIFSFASAPLMAEEKTLLSLPYKFEKFKIPQDDSAVNTHYQPLQIGEIVWRGEVFQYAYLHDENDKEEERLNLVLLFRKVGKNILEGIIFEKKDIYYYEFTYPSSYIDILEKTPPIQQFSKKIVSSNIGIDVSQLNTGIVFSSMHVLTPLNNKKLLTEIKKSIPQWFDLIGKSYTFGSISVGKQETLQMISLFDTVERYYILKSNPFTVKPTAKNSNGLLFLNVDLEAFEKDMKEVDPEGFIFANYFDYYYWWNKGLISWKQKDYLISFNNHYLKLVQENENGLPEELFFDKNFRMNEYQAGLVFTQKQWETIVALSGGIFTQAQWKTDPDSTYFYHFRLQVYSKEGNTFQFMTNIETGEAPIPSLFLESNPFTFDKKGNIKKVHFPSLVKDLQKGIWISKIDW